MTKDEIKSRLAQARQQQQTILAEANRQLGVIDGKIQVYEELLNEASKVVSGVDIHPNGVDLDAQPAADGGSGV